MKNIFLILTSISFLFSSCQKDDSVSSYDIHLQVNGNFLTQIYMRSTQLDFDVTNVPTHEWSADHPYWGNDTLHLTGVQVTDSLNPVIVKVIVSQNGTSNTYIDSNATSCTLNVILPK